MKWSGVLSLALGVIALAFQLQVARTEAVDEHAILDTPAPLGHHVAQAAALPNIVVIVSDDQGFADVSYQPHAEEVHTPNIDRLAAAGVRMTNGYASAFVCAPSRAGLLTGRYQQRYGFYTARDSRAGLPLSEITIADLLQQAGYATGVFGKWHLGLRPPYHPLKRGFDEFYGFLGHGAHDYFDLKFDPDQVHNAIYRNNQIIDETGYLTDNLAREAVSFIDRNRSDPFFLYLPFNAVHFPMQAPAEDIRRFNTGNPDRDVLMAMLWRMDIAIGEVLDALKRNEVWDNTLIFFLSDNGGARKNSADNAPLRDYKQSVYEGGLRVPFVVSWPERLPAGSVSHDPVILFDIFPTICAAAGIDLPPGRIYDGRNMVPLLQDDTTGALHDVLYWDGDDGQWAAREGKWKLLTNKQNHLELYDLEADIGEKQNLVEHHPDVVRRLRTSYETWRRQMGKRISGR